MKKVLLPIDGSHRSLRTIEAVRRMISPEDAEITMLTVLPGQMHIDAQLEVQRDKRDAKLALEGFSSLLPGYAVKTVVLRGSPGDEIVRYARDGAFDSIIMTRSSRGPLRKLGSVAAYVVRNADFVNATIIRESEDS